MSWRAWLTVVLAAAAVLAAIAIWNQNNHLRTRGAAEYRPDYVLTDFTMVSLDDDGKEALTVSAPQLRRNPDTQAMDLDSPTFLFPDNNNHRWHRSNLTTNWLIFDLGFANWRDKTVYGSPEANAYLHAEPGREFTSGDLDLKNTKSSNVNIWLFMQKLNVVHHVINLKYGLGIEMYNYRYSTNISYHKSPDAYIYRDTISFSKNKLAVDYVTVPFMINIDPTPNRRKGFSLSVGMSAGYRYASRNKQISDERGKQKIKGDFDLNPWRFAYIAEAGLGPVRLYGSYSINTLHERGLQQYPYTVGLRFSNW